MSSRRGQSDAGGKPSFLRLGWLPDRASGEGDVLGPRGRSGLGGEGPPSGGAAETCLGKDWGLWLDHNHSTV